MMSTSRCISSSNQMNNTIPTMDIVITEINDMKDAQKYEDSVDDAFHKLKLEREPSDYDDDASGAAREDDDLLKITDLHTESLSENDDSNDDDETCVDDSSHSTAEDIQSNSDDCDDRIIKYVPSPINFRAKPQKSCIKKESLKADIPVCLKKKSWKTLKVPDMSIVRSLSSDEDVDEDQNIKQQQQKQRASSSSRRRHRSICFGDIDIREYNITIGDNPSISYGVPLSLDWDYEHMVSNVSIDEYEAVRPQRRKLRQMALSAYQRQNILMFTYGYTEDDLKQMKKEVKKYKKQRSITRTFLPISIAEDFVTSAGRKAKRVIGGSASGGPSSPNRSNNIIKSDYI